MVDVGNAPNLTRLENARAAEPTKFELSRESFAFVVKAISIQERMCASPVIGLAELATILRLASPVTMEWRCSPHKYASA